MQEQIEKHEKWIREEGGIEKPTHIETLKLPEQRARIEWLKKHCYGSTDILDLGCNWGFILNELKGKCGIDINPRNIAKAMKEFPQRHYLVGDITKPLLFEDNQYAIVILADVLEHLNWSGDVEVAINNALRIARRKILITLPWRKTDDCAYCFKHKWIPSPERIGMVIMQLCKVPHQKVNIEQDGNFVYLEVFK